MLDLLKTKKISRQPMRLQIMWREIPIIYLLQIERRRLFQHRVTLSLPKMQKGTSKRMAVRKYLKECEMTNEETHMYCLQAIINISTKSSKSPRENQKTFGKYANSDSNFQNSTLELISYKN